MSSHPTRRIECAIFSGGIGPIYADELIAMPKDKWGHYRDQITDNKNGKESINAHCYACGSPVFIKCKAFSGQKLPLFSHYSGGGNNCPYIQDKTLSPDTVRKLQYQGKQESAAHRQMCDLLSKVVQLDPRYITHTQEKYLRPANSPHGKFPDLLVEWESYGKFAIEFQLSNTFQTEISERSLFYERENIPLIWILCGEKIATGIPQSFEDVIRRHRGNAFVFDHIASLESHKQKTLCLTCYTKNETGFDPPVVVRFDSLTVPTSQIPYHKDVTVAPLIKSIADRRQPWFAAFHSWEPQDTDNALIKSAIQTLPDNLKTANIKLISSIFTIIAYANGKYYNFASRNPNITGMLNSFLNSKKFSTYSSIIEEALQKTRARHILDGTVKDHLHRHNVEQTSKESADYKVLSYLVPELFDPDTYAHLKYTNELPSWII